MLAGLFNQIDRLYMSILQVPVKAKPGLSYRQVGVLTALALSLLCTTMAVSRSRIAD